MRANDRNRQLKDNTTKSCGSKEFLGGSLSSVSSAKSGGVINTATWRPEMVELRNRSRALGREMFDSAIASNEDEIRG